MSHRAIPILVVAIGVAIFAAVCIFPPAVVALRSFPPAAPVNADLAPPWSVLLTSALLAAAGAAASVLFALPGAYVVGRVGRHSRGALALALLLVPAMCPAMVFAFGWARLVHVPAVVLCVGVWASWAWPVPALMIGAAWARVGRPLLEAALADTTPARAFVRGVLPVLRSHVLAAYLLLFAFFLGDYSVPHACGLVVYATELLLRAQEGGGPQVTFFASLPVAGIISVALIAAALIWRRRSLPDAADATPSPAPHRMLLAILLVTLCVVPPIVGMARAVPVVASIGETVRTYGPELLQSVGVALSAGIVAIFVGAGLTSVARWRTPLVVWSLLWAALPGALIGEMLMITYLQVPAVYDHWPIVVFGYVARYLWVGVLVGWLAQASVERSQLDAARTDGAGPRTIAWRFGVVSNGPLLAGGVFIVTALSLAEVATTSLVRVPTINPVALILIEKFHRLEDGILIALSLMLMAAVVPGAVLAAMAARRQE